MTTLETRTINVPGVEVSLAEAGVGGRPLLALHGFCGAKEDFTEWLDQLATAGWHAVAYDQRGHGRSSHPAGEEAFSLPLFANDVVAVADRLGWDRFVLLGHSMGGMVAQLVALAHPERLDGLILMDTGHGPLEGIDPSLMDLAHQIVRQDGLAALLAAQRDMGPGPLDSAPFLRLCQERPGYQEFCDSKTLAASPDMWLAMTVEMFNQPDRLAALGLVSMPVLVVVGSEDAPFVGPCHKLAAAIPGARLAIIPDAGHSPQFEAPELWCQAVFTFLSEVAE
jgi:pimeloyl-ACP methyl ester carboxylesterase